jgi:hypothetical protein
MADVARPGSSALSGDPAAPPAGGNVTRASRDVNAAADDIHPIREFLLERGAGRLTHPGGTLYEHVTRVAELLAEWGADKEVQVAGLCHACYGTDGYPCALAGLAERPVLRELIGARAESLVYLYASCDRAAVYPALARPGPVPFRDRFTGATRTPPERDVRMFLELTAANELDVIRRNAVMAAEHGPALLWLFAAARPRLSAAAWHAWSAQPGRGLAAGHAERA